jgi:hypothetical protein
VLFEELDDGVKGIPGDVQLVGGDQLQALGILDDILSLDPHSQSRSPSHELGRLEVARDHARVTIDLRTQKPLVDVVTLSPV